MYVACAVDNIADDIITRISRTSSSGKCGIGRLCALAEPVQVYTVPHKLKMLLRQDRAFALASARLVRMTLEH